MLLSKVTVEDLEDLTGVTGEMFSDPRLKGTRWEMK